MPQNVFRIDTYAYVWLIFIESHLLALNQTNQHVTARVFSSYLISESADKDQIVESPKQVTGRKNQSQYLAQW